MTKYTKIPIEQPEEKTAFVIFSPSTISVIISLVLVLILAFKSTHHHSGILKSAEGSQTTIMALSRNIERNQVRDNCSGLALEIKDLNIKISEMEKQLEQKTKTTKTINRNNPELTENSKCESLYHSGKWKNFKQNGFSRKFKNETIKSVYEVNYPLFGHGNLCGQFTADQHFSGTWTGESDCELKILTRKQLTECFNGTTKIRLS